MTSKTAFADITANKLVNKINDLTIGEDSADYLTVNSETRFLNDVNIGGSSIKLRSTDDTNANNFIEIMGERLHSTHVKTIRSINNNKIEGDLTIGEDSTDLLVVNSDTKFTDNIEVSNSITTKNSIVSENIKGTDISYGSSWYKLGQDIYGEAAYDESGYAVSLSSDGTIVAIGAIGNDANGSNSGHVRVYEYSGGSWSQLGADINGSGAGALSGYSVSLSSDGTILAVGEPYYNSNTGLVKIYEYSGSSWLQKGGTINGESASNFCGNSVSLNSNGTILAIGAYGNAGNGSYSGHARVFEYSGSNWSQKGSDIDGEAASDYSGRSVSLSSDGNIVAIGAEGNDGNGTDSGHVRVYEYDGSSWSKLGDDIDGEAAGDKSGISVSLSSDGTIVAIGADANDGNGTDSGHVRVYQYSGNSWSKLGDDIDGEAAGDKSGISVSLSSDGTIVAIGADANDGNGTDSGHVRVYQYSGNSWSKLGQDIDGEATSDWSGYSVSLSSDGTIVAIGAYRNDGNGTDSGHVRVYQYSGGSWSKLGNDIDGEAASDMSGWSVSLSSDGTIVAIGAIGNDANGSLSGHVRVYEYSGSSWSQLGADIDGEASNDKSGFSVSLSSDGTIVAIGARENYGNGNSYSGHVRVYQYSGGSWSKLGADIDGEAASDNSGNSVSLSSDGTIVVIGALYNDANGTSSGHVRVYKITNKNSLNVDGNLEINGNLKVNGNVESNHKGIIQVQSTQYVDQTFVYDTYVSSGVYEYKFGTLLDVNITPRFSNSKIIIHCSMFVEVVHTWETVGLIKRDNTYLRGTLTGSRVTGIAGVMVSYHNNYDSTSDAINMLYVDFPNTTNTVTYSPVLHKYNDTSNAAFLNRCEDGNTGGNFEQGTSTIVVYEIRQ